MSEIVAVGIVEDNERLSARRMAFVNEYVKDFNGAQAAIRAGYSELAAVEQASRLLANAKVKAAVERRAAEAAALADVTTAMIVRELYELATADPRELVSVHRDACRYCHGIDHKRMWTPAEFLRACDEASDEEDPKPAPDLAGGIGFNPTRDPHPDCPECHGRGLERVLVKDTRHLSVKAAKLYAGAQQTREGIKAIARDQNAAVMALGKYLGMFVDKQQISGPGGGPVPLLGLRPEEMSEEQLLAFIAGDLPKADA